MSLRLLFLLAVATGLPMYAEQATPSTPGDQAAGLAASPAAETIRPEEKRLFGLVPNYKSVAAHSVVPPLGWKGKFALAARDSFDPMAFVIVGISAGQSQLGNQYPSLQQGMKGFGRRYIRAEADLVISNFVTEAILPSTLRLDPRYFRLGDGSGLHRAGYALSRIWLIRGDDSKTHFNVPELVGNMVAVGAGAFYYPRENRTVGSLTQRYAFQVGTDAAFNLLKEFWPDINDRLLKRRNKKK